MQARAATDFTTTEDAAEWLDVDYNGMSLKYDLKNQKTESEPLDPSYGKPSHDVSILLML